MFSTRVSVISSALLTRPTAPLDQTLVPTRLGNVCWRTHALRICLLPLRMARPRKGRSPYHHPLQPNRYKRPTILRSIQTPRSGRPCLSLPAPLHRSRIPHQDSLHDPMAGPFLICLRPRGSAINPAAGLPPGPLLLVLHHDRHPAHRVLLACSPAHFRIR